jgi:anti-sigma regulatory factor (Ser/Thr protein kinase)
VAKGVYRFTLGEPLPPGEYVIEVVLPNEQTEMYVWDFGVDAPGAVKTTKPH